MQHEIGHDVVRSEVEEGHQPPDGRRETPNNKVIEEHFIP
jgi:hypothetical protein